MMLRNLVAVAVLVAALTFCASAYADNRLLPTNVLRPGRFMLQLDYDYSSFRGKQTLPGLESDIKGEGHTINLNFGFGLVKDMDVEIECSYVATETAEFEVDLSSWGMGVAEFRGYTEGIDDTTLNLRFLLAKEKRDDVNFSFNLIGIFPSGERKDGQPEIKIKGTIPFLQEQDCKRDYPGTGVASYGAGLALSGTSGDFEPYLAGSYIFGGRRRRHDIKEHYADEATIILGMQVHSSDEAALDLSFTAIHASPETTEDDRDRSREAAHWAGGVSLTMYMEFADDATFMIGISYFLLESHMVDRDTRARMEDASGIIANIGFHVLF